MIEKQRALLIGVHTPQQVDFKESMEELRNLVKACDIEVVESVEQKLRTPHPSYYIGTGKVGEVKEIMDNSQADFLIFNNELSPSQLKNLQKEIDGEVMDRTALILEIFSRRAQTREAKMQVESAQLKYMLPRLVGLNAALGRQGGGSGFRNKGSGEKKIELDRRKIEQRITELDKELERIKGERQTMSKRRIRTGLPKVALVGYTNAGKSTLMNTLVERYNKGEEKKVLEKDMLFATLETSVRSIRLENNKTFLLSDTVGFVSDLPHHLVKAFRSTLEQIVEADLLIHLVDASSPSYKKQLEVTKETLEHIGAEQIPVIYAYNKTDLVEEKDSLEVEENSLLIAAKKNEGIDELLACISEKVFTDYVACEMLIPYDKGEVVAYFNQVAYVKETVYENEGTLLVLECKEADYKRYMSFAKQIE